MGAEPLFSAACHSYLSCPTPTSRLLGAPRGRPCVPELSVAKSLAWTGICRGYLDVGRGRESREIQSSLGMGSGLPPPPPLPLASVSSALNRPLLAQINKYLHSGFVVNLMFRFLRN